MTAVAPRSLALARNRRATLPAAVHALDRALGSPAAEPEWSDRLAARVEQLDRAFYDHVEATEGPAGMYAAVLASDPRLHHAVNRLLAEHRDIRARIERLASLVRTPRGVPALAVAGPPVGPDGPATATLHQEGRELLDLLDRHRRHDADLVHEAYEHDIGGYG